MKIKKAQRIQELPPYLFAEIDKKKNALKARGVDIISLGIGDPDLPTPAHIVARLREAAGNPANHRYPDYEGLPAFRQAAVSVQHSDSELGAFYRRKKAQKGPASAATATAHKIARIYYSLVKNGTEYEDGGARAYEERERERVVAHLKKRAKGLGFDLVERAA